MQGTYVGALFDGQCDKCKVKYFSNYKIGNKGCKIFEDDNHARNRYFQVTSKTVFETQLLQDISSNIWVSGATFQSRAKE